MGAIAALERARRLRPRGVLTRIDLARLLAALGERARAIVVLRDTIRDRPLAAAAHLALAELLASEDRDLLGAQASMRDAIQIEPSMATRHHDAALHYASRGDRARALHVVHTGLALQPEDPELSYVAQTLGEASGLDRAPDAYLVRYFDRLADRFDGLLVDQLAYRAPGLVVEHLPEAHLRSHGNLDILDAGCGTGLCGPLLRPLARTLVGVDIAGAMLERAAQTGAYDVLVQSELIAFLAEDRRRFDIVVAADVLIYFGALGPVVAAVSRRLRPGGVFAFTVERFDGADYQLPTTGRWLHGAEHLRAVCLSAGLQPRMEEAQLRVERGEPVGGYVVVATAPRQ